MGRRQQENSGLTLVVDAVLQHGPISSHGLKLRGLLETTGYPSKSVLSSILKGLVYEGTLETFTVDVNDPRARGEVNPRCQHKNVVLYRIKHGLEHLGSAVKIREAAKRSGGTAGAAGGTSTGGTWGNAFSLMKKTVPSEA